MTSRPVTNTFFSVLWSVLSRWGSKLIGMIATVVLARLLTPADFGVIAMATLVIALLDALTQAGLNLYILRLKQESQAIYNAVWTMGIFQGAIIALPLILLAPYIADFYQQANLEAVIYCLAAIRMMQSFTNVGLIIAQKQLNFRLDFVHTVSTRLVYLLATVVAALLLQNYWAIVIGMAVSGVFGVAASYYLHAFRPRWNTANMTDLLRFAKTTIPLSVGRYINNQGDSLIVGRFASADFLGLYHIASNLASMFTKELLIPVIRGLVPNLAILKQHKDFQPTLQLTFAAAIYVFLPVGIGLALVSYEFVYVFLGEQWLTAAPMLFWFSLYAMLGGILMFFSEQFLVMMEHEGLSNRLMWFRNSQLIIAITATLIWGELTQLPRNLFFASLISLPVILFALCRAIQFSLLGIVLTWLRPIIAVMLMTLCIKLTPDFSSIVAVLLVFKVLAGTLVYILSLVLLCGLFGVADNSVESMMYDKLFKDRINKT